MTSTNGGRPTEEGSGFGSRTRRPPRVIVATIIALAVIAAAAVVLLAALPPSSPGPSCSGPAICALTFSWGTPFNDSGSTFEGCPSNVGHYCYSIEMAGSPSIESLTLSLRSSVSATTPWPFPSTDAVSLVSPVGTILASYGTANSTWTPLTNSTVFAGGNTLVIYTPQTGSAYSLAGDSILARIVGSNGISGSFPSSAFD